LNWNDEALKIASTFDRRELLVEDLYAFKMWAGRLQQHVRSGMGFPTSTWYAIANRAAAALPDWTPEKCADLLVRKQHDYGHDNINAFGHIGIAVRLSDKIARLLNLKDRVPAVGDESASDTLEDIVGYCVIALMLENSTFNLHLKDAA
jgi:hypothetical protein